MAVQLRQKQPRPLSIISEGSLDDILGSDCHSENSNETKESASEATKDTHRNVRRKAVAPLEHPVAELTHNSQQQFTRAVQVFDSGVLATTRSQTSDERCVQSNNIVVEECSLTNNTEASNQRESNRISNKIISIEDNQSTGGKQNEFQLGSELEKRKTGVIKSASFTSPSKKSRPLRRSLGSFDWKDSSILTRYRRLNNNNEDHRKVEESANNKVKFFLSSDNASNDGENNKISFHRQQIAKDCETMLQLLSNRTVSGHKQYSWQEPCNTNKDLSVQQPSFKHTSNSVQDIVSKSTSKPNLQSHQMSSDLFQAIKNPNSVLQSNTQPVRRISSVDQSDFTLLKATANHLNLPIRRPSIVAWKEKYLSNVAGYKHLKILQDPGRAAANESGTAGTDHSKTSVNEEADTRINQSLSRLRQDLISIRLQDQALARQFLSIRHTMNELRLAVLCEGHIQLLEEAKADVEEMRGLSNLVDIPPELMSPLAPLQHVGVTRMNIVSRRFSAC